MEANEPEAIRDMIVRLVQQRIPTRFGFDPLADIQVLTPMNRSLLGARNLNQVLQAALNPEGGTAAEIARFGWTFRVGDRVIQNVNNYDRDVFNGDLGIIAEINRIEQELAVQFEDRTVAYDFGDLDELSLAYVLSIHKSQGSEFPCVVIPLHTQHYLMLQRNLLYTAITRGKQLVVLVGSRKALSPWRCAVSIPASAAPRCGEDSSSYMPRVPTQNALDGGAAHRPGRPAETQLFLEPPCLPRPDHSPIRLSDLVQDGTSDDQRD